MNKDDVTKWLDKHGTSSIPVGSDLLATKDAEPHLQTQEALAMEPMGSILPNVDLHYQPPLLLTSRQKLI